MARTAARPSNGQPSQQQGGFPFTLAQYTALVNAYAAGVLRVEVEGRSVQYRTGDEMFRALMRVQAELQAAGLLPPSQPPLPSLVRYVTAKGLW